MSLGNKYNRYIFAETVIILWSRNNFNSIWQQVVHTMMYINSI